MAKKRKKPLVGIVIGSDSDLPIMKNTVYILKRFKVAYELIISSAHRSPTRTKEYAESAQKRGIEVIIAAAGGAAHLAGVIASHTTLPVIGVPMETRSLKGIDSLLSIVQMPKGIPVATVAIGKSGAINAGILAVQILAAKHMELKNALIRYKKRLDMDAQKKSSRLKSVGHKEYLKCFK